MEAIYNASFSPGPGCPNCTKPDKPPMGSHVDPIVAATCTLLAAARRAGALGRT